MKFCLVIPCYNVADFISETISDLKQQTHTEFSAILVDDGSADDSARVIRETIAGDDRFSLLQLETNRGLSAARNAGLTEVEGDYVLFLDADDRYEKVLLEGLAERITRANEKDPARPVDLAVYGLFEDYLQPGRETYTKIHTPRQADLTDREEIGHAATELERETLLGYAWNKAYRLELLRQKGLQFTVIPHIEDILFNLQAFGQTEHLLLIDRPLYHYINRGQVRLTEKYLPDYFTYQCRRTEEFLQLQEDFKSLDPAALETAAAEYFRSFFSAICRERGHGSSREEILAFCEETAQSPLYEKLRPHLTGGKTVRILYQPLVDGDFEKAYIYAGLVNRAKKYPGIYNRLKQNR